MSEKDHKSEVGYDLLPFAQLGLRLLGIMFLVDGVSGLLGGATQGMLQIKAYSDAGYELPTDPHSGGWIAGSLPHIVAGLYFITGGNWVLNNVFASARNRHRTDDEDNVAATP